MSDRLQEGITAARAGRREEARALLMQVVEADERNEDAWMWLAGVLDDPEEMRICLENVLELNPGNAKAREGLAWVNQRYGPPPPVSLSTPAPAVSQPPAVGPAFTGATTKLPASPAVPAADDTLQPPPVAPIDPANGPDIPCPYCGEPTIMEDTACKQCHKSLMVPAALPKTLSSSTTFLGKLALFFGVLNLPAIMLGMSFLMQSTVPQADMVSTETVIMSIMFLILPSGLDFAVGFGLLYRQRWAYYLCVVRLIVSVISLVQVIFGDIPAESIILIFLYLAYVILYSMLLILSYGDFFSPKVRLLPSVKPGNHIDHYNNGIEYKRQGMWYMAIKEWELAALRSPNNPHYHHALGLAYAEIKKFDLARKSLDQALGISPNDPQLKESRAFIDQLASGNP